MLRQSAEAIQQAHVLQNLLRGVTFSAEARAWRQLYRACGVNTWCDPGSIWTRCLFRLNSSSPFTEEYSWLALTKDCCKLTVDWDVGVKEDILKIFYKELKKCAAESWCDMSGSIQRLNFLFLQSLILGATRGGKTSRKHNTEICL